MLRAQSGLIAELMPIADRFDVWVGLESFEIIMKIGLAPGF